MRLKKTNTRPILSLVCLIIFLGMNLAPITAVNITVNSGMHNSDIQSLINNAKSGDTLNFKSGNYNNVSLIINKKLNVVSTKNVTLNGNYSSGDDGAGKTTFVFYFTNQSSGSSLSGFKINANSDYAIIVNNVKNLNLNSNTINGGYSGSIYLKSSYNINISKNTISNSEGNGVNIVSSSGLNLNNNQILNNQLDGVNIQNSQKINITQNIIKHNQLNGVTLNSSNKILINSNNINNNNGNGISLTDTNTINITANNITYNMLNGLILEGKTTNSYISYNYLIHDLNGIYLDSVSYCDLIISNYIAKSYITSETKYDAFYTGNGIKVGDNYQDTSSRIQIAYNTISGNAHFSVEGNSNYDNFELGPNWYDTNDKWSSGVCPMISTCMLKGQISLTKSGIQMLIIDPSTEQVAPTATSTVNVVITKENSDGSLITVLNTKAKLVNGKVIVNVKLEKNSKYSATVTSDTGKSITNEFQTDSTYGTGNNGQSGNNNGTSQNPGKSDSSGTGNNTNGNGGNNNSNSTGGTSNLNGTGSGESGSGTSTSNGTITGTGQDETQIGVEGASANQGGQQSAGDKSGGSSNGVEVAIKNAINSAVNNPFNNLGILALLGLIGIGYFKRDKLK